MRLQTSTHSLSSSQPKLKRATSAAGSQSKLLSNINNSGAHAQLERVYGLTWPCTASLACSSATGFVAYPAGCTIVLYNGHNNAQAHICNTSRKQFTCCAFTSDGKYLATGENGHEPMVRVWQVDTCTQVTELPGHKFGIVSVAFSPSHKLLVSVGSEHDMVLNVWHWSKQSLFAANKVTSKVSSLCFSPSGDFFVTSGNRHLKFWYLQSSKQTRAGVVPLSGRSAILGDHRNNHFCSVVCVGGFTYSVSMKGMLCQLSNERRQVEKWVDVRTTHALALTAGTKHIFVGCAQSTIRVFEADSLSFVMNVQRPHHLSTDLALGLSPKHLGEHPQNCQFPQTVAMALDSQRQVLTVIYDDHSLYQWHLSGGSNESIAKLCSHLNHVGTIWALDVYPQVENSILPPGTFVTGGADETIRFWTLGYPSSQSPSTTNPASSNHNNNNNEYALPPRNIYSLDLMKVLYLGSDVSSLKDSSCVPVPLSAQSMSDLSSVGVNNGSFPASSTTPPQQRGVRSLRISPDGLHLAAGERNGNVRVYDLQSMQLMTLTEAHDSDVLSLQYSDCNKSPYLMASASRDRLVHVYDVQQQYGCVTTIDDHSSNVTAVRFVWMGDQMVLLSCSADKSIVIRPLQMDNDSIRFIRTSLIAVPSSITDVHISHDFKSIYAACQDRQIRVYSLSRGKELRAFRAAGATDGSLSAMHIDPTGQFVFTGASDKSVSIVHVASGELMSAVCGPSEAVTAMAVSNDAQHLITASGDGCIFIWRLAAELTQSIAGCATSVAEAADVSTALAIDTNLTQPYNNSNNLSSPNQQAEDTTSTYTTDSNEMEPPVRDTSCRASVSPTALLLDDEADSHSHVQSVPMPLLELGEADSSFQVQDRQQPVHTASVSDLHMASAVDSAYDRSDSALIEFDDEQSMRGSSSMYSLRPPVPVPPQANNTNMRRRWSRNTDSAVNDYQGSMSNISVDNQPNQQQQQEPAKDKSFSRGTWNRSSLTGRKKIPPTLLEVVNEPMSPLARGVQHSRSAIDNRTQAHGNSPLLWRPELHQRQTTTLRPNTIWNGNDGNTRQSSASDLSAISPNPNNGRPLLTSTPEERLLVDDSLAMRAHALNRMAVRNNGLKRLQQGSRRLTLPDMHGGANVNMNMSTASHASTPMEHDYNNSELHNRSRSQSPAPDNWQQQQQTHSASRACPRYRNDSEHGSVMGDRDTDSVFSHAPYQPRRSGQGLQTYNSTLALYPASTPTAPPRSGNARKMSDIRMKLRQSTENLSNNMNDAQELYSQQPHSSMARSRSIGNLQHGMALAQRGNGRLMDYEDDDSSMNRSLGTAHMGRENNNSMARQRQLAKSTGNLHQANNQSPQKSLNLQATLASLKRASQTDLRGAGLTDSPEYSHRVSADQQPGSGNDSANDRYTHGSYYERSSTMPRKGKGAVRKKIDSSRRYPVTASGHQQDSDSASDANNQNRNRRPINNNNNMMMSGQFNDADDSNNTVPSSAYRNPRRRPGAQQQSISNEQMMMGGVASPPQRNYLAAKLVGGAAADVEDSDRTVSPSPQLGAKGQNAIMQLHSDDQQTQRSC